MAVPHTPHTWTSGETITAALLNILEQDLAAAGISSIVINSVAPGTTPTGTFASGVLTLNVAAAGSGAVTSVAGRTGAVTLTKTDVALGNVDNTSDSAKPLSTAAMNALAAKADLVGGVIPTAQLPALAIETAVPVANRAAMLALTSTQVQVGDFAIDTSNSATRGSYILLAADPSVIGNWLLLNAPLDTVQSVNGQQGTVVLAASDVGAAPASLATTVAQNTTAINARLAPLVAQPTFTAATSPAIGTIQPYNSSAGALAPVLPALAGLTDGTSYLIVEKDSLDTSSNAVTVTCAGSDTFASGVTTIALTVKGERVEVQAATINGTRVWKVKHHTIPRAGLDATFAPAQLPGYGSDLVEGTDFQSDGHSYGVAFQNGTNMPRTVWSQRLAARNRSATYVNNHVSGSQAADAAGKAAASAPSSFRGVVTWDCAINDVYRDSNAGTAAGFQNGLRTWLLLRRAAARFEAETYATETGTWSAISDAYASNGSARQTTAQGAKQSYAVSGATNWFLLLGGGTNANTFGTAVIAVDGVTVATVNLTGLYATTINNGSRTWFPYAVPVTLSDTAAHTITVTKSDAGAGPVIVDAICARNTAYPPLIVLSKAVYVTSVSTALIDSYNAAIDAVVASVATDGTIMTIDAQAAGFTQALMTNDGIHPSNYGAAFIASVAQRAINRLTTAAASALRTGADVNGSVSVTAVVTPPAGGGSSRISDNFDRADSTTSLGATNTGQTWTYPKGTWGLANGKAYSVTNTGDMALVDTGLADQRVSAAVTFDSGGGVALQTRSNAAGTTCYMVNIKNGPWALYSIVNGNGTLLGQFSQGVANGDTVEIDAVGTAITVKRNGTTVGTVTDSSVTAGTYAGLRQNGTYSATWDNFAVN